MSKLLYIVDDDRKIRELLRTYLEKNNFRVRVAADGETFLEEFRASANDISLVILDIMLPGQDGFSVCRTLRSESDVPVIMLTANADETDRVVGLELGADDYLSKPFSPRELLARVKAVQRRYSVAEDTEPAGRYYRFKTFWLDSLERTLRADDSDWQTLSGADYDLLLFFLRHAGEVVPRSHLMVHTRGRDMGPFDRYLDVQISRLRQRLGDDGKSPRLIKTVRGEGYVFSAEVSRHRGLPHDTP
ncbi:response regulator transcription factor [Natronospirillum operosum]|uniref:Response regulator transcription factor n=1 Tax=Natronospirillum operosum TaxID=2759953 RepID=A0A4Z0WJ24_9GAMM|nr:response regulator transcription factor [Natronospirillum operosum]TGG95866.1 response regulator transcription factor [Natronospirillum operosum]